MSDTSPKAYNPELLARLEQPDEAQKARPKTRDLRGQVTTAKDASEHRRYAWLYEDLLN
ncbi:hypothetical protein [Roseovarius aestuariivivens]|uniref:hypothetical protein n=1 Tax=Roseovarius aestuariivivens TaxID=1888910 RepID=UPI0014367980|nr:hypothetical protein [Roseovarius aestuariivivens]